MGSAENQPPDTAAESCQVTEVAGPRLQVRMRGTLAADWAGRLAAALAARRINVIRLEGARHSGRCWDVALVVEPLEAVAEARRLDYLALARNGRGPAGAAVAGLALDAFSLTRNPQEVVVDVEAADALGFLDRILRVFAHFSLFPRALHVETRGQKVRDQFRLVDRDGQVPPLQVCEAVGLRLRDLAGPEAE
jgi:hypothetical protein